MSLVRSRSLAAVLAPCFAPMLLSAAGLACVGPGTVGDAGLEDRAATEPPDPDAAVSDASSADVARNDAATATLAARVEALMRPAFDPTPSSLAQCVGGVAVIVTPAEERMGGWGATTLGGSVSPDASTLFQIGSLTKVFTGLAMAQRIEEGAFGPDTRAGELLAEDLRGASASWPTMAALITHHGGLPAYPSNLVDRDGDGRRDPGIDPRSPAAGYGRADLRAALASWTSPSDAPYSYSNVGSGLVGLALQDQLGLESHDETLRRTVTSELGMRETWGEVSAIPPEARARLADGHAREGDARVIGIPGQMGVLASAGEIVTSARDMRLLLRALTGLERTGLAGAISRATTPLAAGPDGREMGYAIEIENLAGVVRYRKGGNTSSYAAYLLWSTSPQVGVAVLTNCGGFMSVVTLSEQLYEAARSP